MAPVIVHAIPEGVFSSTYHGSYKDTVSRIRVLEQSGSEYRQVRLTRDNPETALAALPEHDNIWVLVEYSHFPRIVRALRQRLPKAFVAVRNHNIEVCQHLANHGWWPRRGPLWMLYGMARLFSADLTCKRYADAIYSISDWENRVYWNRLPGKARVEWLPYYCPDHLLPVRHPRVPIERGQDEGDRKIIACLPTSQKNRKSWDLVTRFLTLAERARMEGAPYQFTVTGDLADWNLPESPHVTYTGLIDDLTALLQRSVAVCQLSPLGYGFKTTMGDAVAHGGYVLAHPALARRCPPMLQPAVIPVDTTKPQTIDDALERLKDPFPVPEVNDTFRNINHRLLTQDFRLEIK